MTKNIKKSSKKTTESPKKTSVSTKKTTESPKKTIGSPKKTNKTIKKTIESPKKTNVLKAKDTLRVVLDQKSKKTTKSTQKTTKSPQKTTKSDKMDQNETIFVLLERNGNEWSSKVIPQEQKNSLKQFPLHSASSQSPEEDQTSSLGLGVHLPLSYNSDDLEFFSSSSDQPTSDIDLFEEESSEADTETAQEPLESSKISKTVLESRSPYNRIQ